MRHGLLGLDERGREVLTYADGVVVWPDHVQLVESDAALASVAALIRSYHDAIADFAPPPGASWSDRGGDPWGAPEVLCHNDLAPWNLVRGSAGWTFIDWDLAAPGRRAWDLAWAVLGFVPLMPFSRRPDDATRHRLRTVRDAYGADLYPTDVLEVAVERCDREVSLIRERGAAGEEPYVTLLADGHADVWEGAAAHVRAHTDLWVI